MNFKPKRKKKEVRSLRHQFTFRGRDKMIKEKYPEVMNHMKLSHICEVRGEELYESRLSQL